MNEPTFWEGIGFQDRLSIWLEVEQPPLDVAILVIEWIRSRVIDPYTGVRRYTAIAGNLWWGRVPGTFRDGSDVMCSYWIDEDMRQVRCDSIATLARPNLH